MRQAAASRAGGTGGGLPPGLSRVHAVPFHVHVSATDAPLPLPLPLPPKRRLGGATALGVALDQLHLRL